MTKTNSAGKPRGILSSIPNPRIRYYRDKPTKTLQSTIEHFWMVRWDFPKNRPYIAETLPHPSVHLVFEKDGSSIGGPVTGKFKRTLNGKGFVFGVKFLPGAFSAFYKPSIANLANHKVNIESVFGESILQLEHSILRMTRFDAMEKAAESFFTSIPIKHDPRAILAQTIVATIMIERDIVHVRQLLARFNITARSLERLFENYIGVTPKWVIQRYRLHEAVEMIKSNAEISLTKLALDLGYHDQAHFIRDFKALIGITPSHFLRNATGKTV